MIPGLGPRAARAGKGWGDYGDHRHSRTEPGRPILDWMDHRKQVYFHSPLRNRTRNSLNGVNFQWLKA